MSDSKARLRKSLKQARLAIPAEERTAKSQKIRERLLEAIDWSQIECLHCFEPIEKLAEVDVRDFVQGIPTFTSRRENECNDWSIVPVTGEQEVPEQFDAIIVPMLGFDPKTLHRIGFGGGYYDRFLATQPRALKIGVCFEQGKLDNVPAEPHDIPLDLIITEQKAY